MNSSRMPFSPSLFQGFIRSKATLVICPASLLSQWEGEVKKRVKSGAMRVHVYHGTSRGQSAKVTGGQYETKFESCITWAMFIFTIDVPKKSIAHIFF